MLKFVFLTSEFYADYSKCSEIEKKQQRPYIRVAVQINELTFAIPLRSNIKHPHVLWTDKENRCGVDFSKAVVITNPDRYIDQTSVPYIRPNEFDALRGKEYQIEVGLKKYISKYIKAKQNSNIPRNRQMLECSTLQYFEEFLGSFR